MENKFKILHLENTPADAELVESELKKGNLQFEILVIDNKTDYEKALIEFTPDLILANHTLSSFDSFEALRLLKQKDVKIPFILVTSTVSDEYAVELMKAGANDFIPKNRINRLPQAVKNVIGKKKQEHKLQLNDIYLKGMLSSLSSQMAVINADGILVAVNKAWDDFAKNNGVTNLSRVSIGSNYFDVCKKAIKNGDSYAELALMGIQSVLNEERQFFEMEYPCHSPQQKRWFLLNVNPFENDSHKVVVTHTNITERKIAENNLSNTSFELQKTLSDLNQILNSSLDVICTINAEGEFVNVSAASQQVWGYPPKELIGSKFMDLVYFEDENITLKAIEKITNGIPLTTFENRNVHKNGRVIPILWSLNWDEKLQLITCIAKDISEKKKLKKAIENERDQFFEMFSKAPSAIGMLKGANHVFEMANPLYLQLTGKKDVIGKTVAEVFPELVEQGFIALLDHVYKTGESYIGSELLAQVDTKGNGELTDFYMNVVYQAYRNSEGEIEGIFFFINDITEQVTSRKNIEKSEKQYRHIIETAQEGIWQIDENNRINFVNKKICETLEYTEEEILGKEPFAFMDAEGKEKFLVSIERRKKGIAENYEFGFVSKNGKHILTNISANPFFDKSGNYKGTLGMVTDITEKKIADQKSKFKADLLNTIAQAAIATDLMGVVNYWNKAAENIYGWTAEEAIGKNIMQLTTSKATETEALKIMDNLKNGRSWTGEFRVQHKNGSDFPVLISNSPIFDENNNFSGIIGISSDITEKKKLEALLEKSNRLARIGFWEIDVVNGTVFWSDITKEIREAEPDFIPDLKTGIGFFTKGKNKNIILKRVSQCIDKGIPWDEELQLETFKGNLKWVRTIGEAEFVKGKCIKVYGSFQDITERKKAENERNKMISDIVQRNTDLEQFSYIVSHNLRAPAANIIGFTEILLDETLTPEEQKESLQGLSASAVGLDTVIKDINMILQNKRGIHDKKEIVIFSKLLNDIEISIGNLIDKFHVGITSDFSEVDEIYSLKIYMYSIFYNLISNSIKYGKANEPPSIEIRSKKEDGKIILIFKDNGLGIDLKTKEDKIFGLYNRFHSHVEGKGMGLFMVKTQVESLGGKISIASELHRGTEFIIELKM